jgi:hypothetical protein
MSTYKRHGNRWTINEILSLQREYELLEWTVQEIAQKHQRSVRAILCKLEVEGFIGSWDDARGFNFKEYQDICDGAIDEESVAEFDDDNDNDNDNDDDYDYEDDETLTIDDKESDVDRLTERVWNLETSVKDIGSMVTKMFDSWVTKKAVKREPLRKY